MNKHPSEPQDSSEGHLLPPGVHHVSLLLSTVKKKSTTDIVFLSKRNIYSFQGGFLCLSVTKYMSRTRKRDVFTYSTMTGVETDSNSPDIHISMNTVWSGLMGHCRLTHKHPPFTSRVTIRCVCVCMWSPWQDVLLSCLNWLRQERWTSCPVPSCKPTRSSLHLVLRVFTSSSPAFRCTPGRSRCRLR